MYIGLDDLKIHVPALVVVGGAALPADLVALRAARAAGSIADLLDGGVAIRLSQNRTIVNKFVLVYKHQLDG